MSLASEDEWEYEYDETDQEVYLIDVDLTTANRSITAASATRTKRTLDVPLKPKAKPVAGGRKRQAIEAEAVEAGTVDNAEQNDEERDPGADKADEHSVQILDLHTANPLISYNGYMYSCTWYDLVGTNMFFSEHQDLPLFDPDLATEYYDLIGMSRIKLVGHQVHLKPKPPPKQDTNSRGKPEPAGKSLGTIRTHNAKQNIDLKKQANFLKQLMEVKRSRGESDRVHVVVNDKIVKALQERRDAFSTEERRAEIDELNARVVRGDQEAYDKLEDLYCGEVDNADNEDGVIVTSHDHG